MNGSILIVDDNMENVTILERILSRDGHTVRNALSGQGALDSVFADPPDLIMLDMIMPGMDGFQVCKSLKSDPGSVDIPVIFISALNQIDDKVKAFDAGGIDYITKPFAEREVLARVRTHLKNSAAQIELLRMNRELSREIDARRLAESESAEKSYKLFQILQRIPVPAFVIDAEHQVTHWNKALESLTGLPADEMIGTRDQWRSLYKSQKPTMADIVMEGSAEKRMELLYSCRYRKSLLMDSAYEVEEQFADAGPAEGKWFFLTAAPLTDSSGAKIGAIETMQDITEQKRTETKLRESEQRYRELSITDSLTKLYNSRHFFRQLSYEVERAKRYRTPLSMILLDIDDFKLYNDTYGHPEGDLVLKALSHVIRGNLRFADTAFRYGGEEFTMLLPETTGNNSCIVAERIRKDFEQAPLNPLSSEDVHMSVSIGVAELRPDEQAHIFLKRVDEAMYRAKREGKNRVVTADL